MRVYYIPQSLDSTIGSVNSELYPRIASKRNMKADRKYSFKINSFPGRSERFLIFVLFFRVRIPVRFRIGYSAKCILVKVEINPGKIIILIGKVAILPYCSVKCTKPHTIFMIYY